MPESQLMEYKKSWRDEYFKWICGFANAQSGVLYIGIDDKGKTVGVQNAKKLFIRRINDYLNKHKRANIKDDNIGEAK